MSTNKQHRDAAKAKQEPVLEASEEAKMLATRLHENFCHLNHTDYCGWFYTNDWDTSSVHQDYLARANRALSVTDIETAMRTAKAFSSKG